MRNDVDIIHNFIKQKNFKKKILKLKNYFYNEFFKI